MGTRAVVTATLGRDDWQWVKSWLSLGSKASSPTRIALSQAWAPRYSATGVRSADLPMPSRPWAHPESPGARATSQSHVHMLASCCARLIPLPSAHCSNTRDSFSEVDAPSRNCMWSGRPTADLHDQGGVGEHGSCDIVGESNAFALSKPTASHAIHVSMVITRYRSCGAQHGSMPG